ncbi:hypothetical protein GG344DRAFT_77110 [Lentinula edodes]|nr:hypothetical protein GG344DRAFT_77110 [Lentinula edodes]
MSSAPPQIPPDTSPSIPDATTQTSFTLTRLPNAQTLLESYPSPNLPELPSYFVSFGTPDLGSVEATPHVKLRTASPLPPHTLEDVHPQAQPPGTYPPWHIPSRELTPSRPIYIYDLLDFPHSSLTSLRVRDLPGPPRNPLKGHHLIVPATTGSFPSSVAVLVAPFKLQPAPSTLQHKPPYTKTYLKTYFDPGLTGKPQNSSNSGQSSGQQPAFNHFGADGKVVPSERKIRMKNNLCLFCGDSSCKAILGYSCLSRYNPLIDWASRNITFRNTSHPDSPQTSVSSAINTKGRCSVTGTSAVGFTDNSGNLFWGFTSLSLSFPLSDVTGQAPLV